MASGEIKYSLSKQFSSPSSVTEPMVLGSPSSPISGSTTASHSQYLPGFLLGDHTPTIPSSLQSPKSSHRLWSGSNSMSALKNSSSSTDCLHIQSPQSFGSAKRFAVGAEDTLPSRPKEKFSAPPISGLLDTSVSAVVPPHQPVGPSSLHHSLIDGLDNSQNLLTSGFSSPLTSANQHSHSLMNMSHSTPAVTAGTPNIRNTSLSSLSQAQCSPTQLDPFYTQGEDLTPDDELDETWVTVFGFPQGAAGHVLLQFSEYGTLLKHYISNDGNWMHLHYQSKIAAKKALSKNGKVLANNIMVGVSQCIDKAAMRSESLGRVDREEGIRLHSLNRTLNEGLNTSTALMTPTKTGTPIRSLTKAYDSSTPGGEMSSANGNGNGAWWKKAMEYAFGW